MNQKTTQELFKAHVGLNRQMVVLTKVPKEWVSGAENIVGQHPAWREQLAFLGCVLEGDKWTCSGPSGCSKSHFLEAMTSQTMSLEDKEKKGREGT